MVETQVAFDRGDPYFEAQTRLDTVQARMDPVNALKNGSLEFAHCGTSGHNVSTPTVRRPSRTHAKWRQTGARQINSAAYDPIAASLSTACLPGAVPSRASICSARYSASRATPEKRPDPQVWSQGRPSTYTPATGVTPRT